MPLYMCNAEIGVIQDKVASQIAEDITRIHCEVTAAPPNFVHAFFFENASHMPLAGKTVRVTGTIRRGRTDKQMEQIANKITQSVLLHAGVPMADIDVTIADTPASWVMEGGDIMPEPGDEAEWLAAHDAKLAATS